MQQQQKNLDKNKIIMLLCNSLASSLNIHIAWFPLGME